MRYRMQYSMQFFKKHVELHHVSCAFTMRLWWFLRPERIACNTGYKMPSSHETEPFLASHSSELSVGGTSSMSSSHAKSAYNFCRYYACDYAWIPVLDIRKKAGKQITWPWIVCHMTRWWVLLVQKIAFIVAVPSWIVFCIALLSRRSGRGTEPGGSNMYGWVQCGMEISYTISYTI